MKIVGSKVQELRKKSVDKRDVMCYLGFINGDVVNPNWKTIEKGDLQMNNRKRIKVCMCCMEEIASRGEKFMRGEAIFWDDFEDAEDFRCEWCDEETDELYDIEFR